MFFKYTGAITNAAANKTAMEYKHLARLAFHNLLLLNDNSDKICLLLLLINTTHELSALDIALMLRNHINENNICDERIINTILSRPNGYLIIRMMFPLLNSNMRSASSTSASDSRLTLGDYVELIKFKCMRFT